MNYLEFNPEQPETIVLLHAGNVAGWMWGEQVPAFADYHLLVPDLPGFGESNHLPWVSLAAAAADVAALVTERARGGRAHVVGLSLGSSVALELAAGHPETVIDAFLASATVARQPIAERVAAHVMLAFWRRRWFWTGLARAYGLPADSVDLFVQTGLGISPATARRVVDEVGAGVPPSDFAAIAVPAIVVAGEKDVASVRRDSLRALAAGVPGILAATAPGMHHQWNIENVELFNAALRTWLTERAVHPGLVAVPG